MEIYNKEIMNKINSLIGTPFSEMNCYQLVKSVYLFNRIELPEKNISISALKQIYKEIKKAENSGDWKMVDKPEFLDVITFRGETKLTTHIGIYLLYGKFIHSRIQTDVTVERLDSPLWKNKITGIFRYVRSV